MSDSPLDKKPNAEKTDVQFSSQNIGRWASKQENPFAKQNRERQAKRREQDKKRQKAAPFIVILSSAVVIGVALWGLVMIIAGWMNQPKVEVPTIAGSTEQDMIDYRDKLQGLFNQNVSSNTQDKLQEIQNAVNGTLKTPDGRQNENVVKLAQMIFLVNNQYYDEAAEIAKTFNPDELTIEQQINYYTVLRLKAQRDEDYDENDRVSIIIYNLYNELGDDFGYGEEEN